MAINKCVYREQWRVANKKKPGRKKNAVNKIKTQSTHAQILVISIELQPYKMRDPSIAMDFIMVLCQHYMHCVLRCNTIFICVDFGYNRNQCGTREHRKIHSNSALCQHKRICTDKQQQHKTKQKRQKTFNSICDTPNFTFLFCFESYQERTKSAKRHQLKEQNRYKLPSMKDPLKISD